MCGYFCIGFINFIFENKSLIDFTSLFFAYDFQKNYKIILIYFKKMVKMKRKFMYYFFN